MPWPMLSSKSSRKVEQFRSRCQEEMREEEIVKRNQKKVEPISKWRCPRQAGPESSLELDLLLVRCVPDEGGSAGRSGTQGDRKRGLSRSPGRQSMDKEADDGLGGLVA